MGPGVKAQVVELEPGGADRVVSDSTRVAYLDALAQWRLAGRCRPALMAFLAGTVDALSVFPSSNGAGPR